MQKYIRLNTAITLPVKLSKKVIDISKKLGTIIDTEFTLDGKHFIPHITLYTVEYPIKNRDNIYKALSLFSKKQKSFAIELTGIRLDDSEGSLGAAVNVKKDKRLYEFHKEIIEILNPLREGHIREKYKLPGYLEKFAISKRKLMAENIKSTGYARVYDAYDPHISLTAFKINTYKKSDTINIFNPTTMIVKNIGIFTTGEWGTCTKLLRKFDLKG